MSTPAATATCAVCGHPAVVWEPVSLPPPAEPPDFDTRPGEPQRSTMYQWIQSCPHCGYAAEDISSAAPEAADVVRSENYQALRTDSDVPPQARPFLCYALLLCRLHQYADAGWSTLHAAWVCDDLGAEDAAALCRSRAIATWQQGKAAGQSFADDMASEFALVTDVYRRIGDFEQATVACAEGLDLEDIPPALDAVLRRQSVLITQRDTSRHSIAELLQTWQ